MDPDDHTTITIEDARLISETLTEGIECPDCQRHFADSAGFWAHSDTVHIQHVSRKSRLTFPPTGVVIPRPRMP